MGFTNMPDELLRGGFQGEIGSGPWGVYLTLRSYRRIDDGIAWPSWSTLMRETGLSKPTLNSCLKRLIEEGWVVQVHRGKATGDSSKYYVALVETGERTTGKETLPVKKFNQLRNFTGTGKKSLPELVKKFNPSTTISTTSSTTNSSSVAAPQTPSEEKPSSKSSRKKHTYTAEFEEFWKLYPKKAGKLEAFKQFKVQVSRGMPTGDALAKILAEHREHNKNWRDGNREFILDPERWLKKGHWENEFDGGDESGECEEQRFHRRRSEQLKRGEISG